LFAKCGHTHQPESKKYNQLILNKKIPINFPTIFQACYSKLFLAYTPNKKTKCNIKHKMVNIFFPAFSQVS
jgi:hypothetical protein